MSSLADRQEIQTPEDLIAHWRYRKRIIVPNRSGGLSDLIIVSLDTPAKVAGHPVDAIVAAQATTYKPVKSFAVVIEKPPPAINKALLCFPGVSSAGYWVLNSRRST